MILTPRDEKIISDLQSYGIFATRRIASRYFPGVAMTTVLRRLRALEKAGYVQRVPGLDGGRLGWAVTSAAKEKRQFSSAKVHFRRDILDHDLKLTDLRLRLEDAGIPRAWRPEHEIRAQVARKHGLRATAARNIPDGLMVIEAKGFKETVAVELELSPKNQDRYRRIFSDYRLKENLWAFWYVVERATIGRKLEKAAKTAGYYGAKPFFLWSLLEDVMRDPLSAEVRAFESRYKLGDLWAARALGSPDSPAHIPAQGVRGQAHAESRTEKILTTENQMQKTAS